MKRNRFGFMAPVDGGDGSGGGGAAGTPPGGAGSSDGGAAPAATWYSTFSTPELRGVVENNGWKTPEDAVRNYAELSKTIGVPKDYLLQLPQKDDDVDGWNKVYQRLGRPDKADDYGLGQLEGADPKFAATMAQAFYEAGASKKTVAAVMAKYQDYAKGFFGEQEAQGKLAAEADTSKLRGEWGDQYQATVERGGQALQELWGDQSKDIMDALQAKLGVYGAAKAVAKLADKAGEGTFRTSGEGTGNNSTFGMSADGARAEVARLKADPSFVAELLGDNQQQAQAARTRLNRLMQVAYPGNVEGVGATASR